MDMESSPAPSEVFDLFVNRNPDEVWSKAADIVASIDPALELARVHGVFLDVIRLFRGEYPGYKSIQTPYHDLSHTLDVFMCSIRLAHGVQLSGVALSSDEVAWIMIAALMHDIGYAKRNDETGGTGAQFTRDHVKRGIAFMHAYADQVGLPIGWRARLEVMMLGTDHMGNFESIRFPDEKARLLAQIVATADLIGQMSDRTYLEKLLYLYLEFREAHLGNYQGMYDLLRKTRGFYEFTRREKLDGELDGLYRNLSLHFKSWLGSERNYYLESLEKNMAYLSLAAQLDETACLAMLKRGGIVKAALDIAKPNGCSSGDSPS